MLLAFAALERRPLRTDWLLVAVLAALPFALAYGLVYWGEQYIPSGLAAVLFGVLPLYTGSWPVSSCPRSRCARAWC